MRNERSALATEDVHSRSNGLWISGKHRRRWPLSAGSVFLVICAIAQPSRADEKPLWVAIGPKELVAEVEPLAAHRRDEGFEALIVKQSVSKALQDLPRRPVAILLVGDDQTGKESQPWYVGARRRPLYRWRAPQKFHFASDALWGDFDEDLVPDVPVGRIPARSPEQVRMVVKKILNYEQKPPSIDDLRLAIWAGSPNYGATIDRMATSLLLGSLRGAPQWAQRWVISSDRMHPLCAWPTHQSRLFTEAMKQGGVVHVLMGHATPTRFFSMQHAGQPVFYSANATGDLLQSGQVTPPLVVFTCSSGNFARPKPCMAESFLFMNGGPVATIAATTESHPLTNYFSGKSMLAAINGPGQTLDSDEPPRLGELWLRAQLAASKSRSFLMERVLKDVEGKLEDEINVDLLRRDQLLMYAILGDPATTVRIPRPLEVDVQQHERGWEWSVKWPKSNARIEVGLRSESQRIRPLSSPIDNDQTADEQHEQANQQFAFRPLAAPDHDGSGWHGIATEPGLLRLAVILPDRMHVATVELKADKP